MSESDSESVTVLRAQLAETRARNEELERELRATEPRVASARWRSFGAAALIVLGVVCMSVSPVAIWSRNLLLDTNHYVAVVTPIGQDERIQDAVVRLVDRQIDTHLDVPSLLNGAVSPRFVPARVTHLIGPLLQSAATTLVRTITIHFMRSKAFQRLWVSINRIGHEQVTYLLTGKRAAGSVPLGRQGEVILNLAPVLKRVRTALVDAGITLAGAIPVVGLTIEVANLPGVQHVPLMLRTLDAVANWLPLVGLALIAVGLVLAQRVRRALISAALGVATGAVVIKLALAVGREVYLDRIPTAQLPRDAAAYVFDTVVTFLQWELRIVLLVAALIAVGAWLFGPGRVPGAVRGSLTRAPRAIRDRFDAGPLGALAVDHTVAIRIGVIVAMTIVLFVIDEPSSAIVILLTALTVALLLILEILRRMGRSQIGTRQASHSDAHD